MQKLLTAKGAKKERGGREEKSKVYLLPQEE